MMIRMREIQPNVHARGNKSVYMSRQKGRARNSDHCHHQAHQAELELSIQPWTRFGNDAEDRPYFRLVMNDN